MQDHPNWVWTISNRCVEVIMVLTYACTRARQYFRDVAPSSLVLGELPLSEGSLPHVGPCGENSSCSPGEAVDTRSSLLPWNESVHADDDAAVASQSAAPYQFDSKSFHSYAEGAAAAVSVFVLHGLVAGVAFWLASDYPFFLCFKK